MAKTDWKKGDKITSELLNQTGSPIQVSNNTLKEGDATELPSGQLIVDNNGGLYVSSSAKLVLVAVLKGKDGATGPAGKDGTNGKDGAKGDPGADGKDGATGAAGKDAKQIKAGVINEDKNGIVTGIKVTFTDNTTVDFSVNKATE